MAKEFKIGRHEQYKGATYTYSVDTALIDQRLGVTSSAATWTTEDSSVVTIGTSLFSGGIGSAPITANSKGTALVKVSITTNGDDAPIYYLEINVLDPES